MTENMNESFEELLKISGDIVIYGEVQAGMKIFQWLKQHGVGKRILFCSTQEVGEDLLQGASMISLHELYSMDREHTVLIVYSDDEAVQEKKERMALAGFCKIFCCIPGLENYYHIIRRIPDIKEDLAEVMEDVFQWIYFQKPLERLRRPHDTLLLLSKMVRISEAYNLLEDEISRTTFKNILKYRASGKTKFLKEVCVYPQYFMQDIFTFTDHEVYVDAGAAQGDSILNFMDVVQGNYKKIYGFEAKKSYCAGMQELFSHENVEIIETGLHRREGILYFHDLQHGSYVSLTEESAHQIAVTSLDDTVQEEVTFIKMDIEGSEIDALEGAKRIIGQYKPKLAICVYHLEEDLWEIPLLIHNMVPGYKIYLRHHYDVMDEETVCYAV